MTMWIARALCHDKTLMKLISLGEKISDLTLSGLFWDKKGALALEKERLKINKRFQFYFVEFLSVASSTYYAASGNAASRAKVPNLFLKVFWYWMAWRCLRMAEKLSDKFASLKKMEDMSLGELNVWACILNKAGRRNEAVGLLSHGIMKISTGQLGTKHDLCLFLIHEAEVISSMRKYDKENKAEKNYQQAMELMEDRAVLVLTSVRIMKSYGKFLTGVGRITEAKEVLTKALILAEASDLNDQAVKIKALLTSAK